MLVAEAIDFVLANGDMVSASGVDVASRRARLIGHLKRTIMGREVVVAVTDGKLDFGPWEQIFYGEFDGKRRKRVLVKIIGE